MAFDEIFLTAGSVSIALISCFAIGLPAVVFGTLFCKKRLDAVDVWFYAPLVGVAFVILVCQNLLYLDIPISQSAIFVWALAAASWLWLLTRATTRALLYPVPWLALVLATAVYVIHASGLFSLGASSYYGYGWVDMFNYVSMAQFFADLPFHSNISDQEFLKAAQHFKHDRIGQSVLHSFLMVSSGTDAQQSFGTTILLSPFLMFFGFLTIARRLTQLSPISYLAALAGALSPAVATVHLECFFSQSMCVPFLLLWPAAINHLVDTPGWRSALLAGLLISVITAIFTEIFPIILAVVLVCSVVGDISSLEIVRARFSGTFLPRKRSGRPFTTTLLWLPLAVLVGIVSNPGYLQSALEIFSRTTTGNVLAELYPWAFKLEGLVRLWIGNQAPRPPETIFEMIAGVTVLVFICNLFSLKTYAKHCFSTFFFAFVLLMFIPLGPLVLGGGSRYPYQFYKLVLTVAPLHAFWFVIGLGLLREYSIVSRNLAFIFASVLVTVDGLLTLGIANASAKVSTVATSHRGGANLLIDSDFRQIRNWLGRIKDRDVFTLWYDDQLYSGAYRTEWINYFARHNRVWSLITGQASAEAIEQRFSGQRLSQVSSAIVVTWRPVDELKDRLVFVNPLVSVYETGSQEEMQRLIEAARSTIFRKLRLDVNSEADPASWYPVWVSGVPGNATLFTIKFGESNEFRYDQWGYPAVYLTPGSNCKGRRMALTLRLLLLEKRLRIECNGDSAEADLPLSRTSLESRGPARFGWSAGITSLEGKYPLWANFPGSVVEMP